MLYHRIRYEEAVKKLLAETTGAEWSSEENITGAKRHNTVVLVMTVPAFSLAGFGVGTGKLAIMRVLEPNRPPRDADGEAGREEGGIEDGDENSTTKQEERAVASSALNCIAVRKG
ncbi:hypothetical protein V5799_003713 [Amblyomma americanum]|uniref:Uncharacterized protein n=1 Tax=Amblyomma americanum TaxID=6943 RepID=A0AAQ4D864_AMBAM